MEAALASDGPWLMGARVTLADIDLLPFVNRFETVYPDILNATAAAKAMAWLTRLRARPAVIAVFSTASPTGRDRRFCRSVVRLLRRTAT